MNKEWLYTEYVIKDRSTQDIADEYGCKRNTIQCWLSKHDIKKESVKRERRNKKIYETYEYLFQQHIELRKSMAEIARENNVSGDTIRSNLIKNGITPWQTVPHSQYSDSQIDTMVDLYINKKMSANQISKLFNTDHNTIIRQLKGRGIDTRSFQEAQFCLNNKDVPDVFYDTDTLREWHIKDGMTCKEIGDKINVDAGTIRRQMKKLGIKTRNNSESKVGLMTGSKHHNWQGGLTPLYALLREYFTVNLAPIVAKRDDYTCQLCGAKHVVLHVHHIRTMKDIVHEICSEHSDIDVTDTDGKLAMYNIIVNDNRFLDTDNLITYCKNCHLFKIHRFKRKTISSQASYEEGSETIPSGSTP